VRDGGPVAIHDGDLGMIDRPLDAGTDQRGADLPADRGRIGPLDRSHGIDDAEYRRDDAESGQRIGHLLHRVAGFSRFLVMGLELVLEETLELVRIQIATDDQAQTVGDELDHVMIREDARILGEHLALLGRLDVRLDRQHAGLPDLHQDVVQELEQIQIVPALVAGRFQQTDGGGKGLLHDLHRVAGQEGAESRAQDDDELARVIQQQDAAAFHQKAAKDASENEDGADDR